MTCRYVLNIKKEFFVGEYHKLFVQKVHQKRHKGKEVLILLQVSKSQTNRKVI